MQSSVNGNLLPAHFVSVHLPKLHAEVRAAASTPSLGKPQRQSPLNKCTTCNYRANSKSQLNMHIRKVHDVPAMSLVTPVFEISAPFNVLPLTPTFQESPAKFKCFIAGCTETYHEWQAHEKSAHNLKCPSCEKILVTGDELRDHMRAEHEICPFVSDISESTSTVKSDALKRRCPCL